jgi:hypothetical protein
VIVRFLPYIVALLLGVAASLVVGCGDRTKLIPASNAGRLNSDLDTLQNVVGSGSCNQVQRALQQARNDLVALPSTVSTRLTRRLSDGIAALERQAPTACRDAQAGQTTATEPTTTETTPTDTTPTDTTPTDTTTTETNTTPTATTPTTTTPTTPTTTTSPSGDGTGGAGVPPGGATTP